MNVQTIAMLGAAILILAVLGGLGMWAFSRRLHSENLHKKFGTEYDYAVSQLGDQRQAEKELEERQKRIEKLDIRSLTVEEQEHYLYEWQSVQAQFVDKPITAVQGADRLIQQVMTTRGFPEADLDQRIADISVLYPSVAANYREARKTAFMDARSGTEDLRQAMLRYRMVFDDLLAVEEELLKESVK